MPSFAKCYPGCRMVKCPECRSKRIKSVIGYTLLNTIKDIVCVHYPRRSHYETDRATIRYYLVCNLEEGKHLDAYTKYKSLAWGDTSIEAKECRRKYKNMMARIEKIRRELADELYECYPEPTQQTPVTVAANVTVTAATATANTTDTVVLNSDTSSKITQQPQQPQKVFEQKDKNKLADEAVRILKKRRCVKQKAKLIKQKDINEKQKSSNIGDSMPDTDVKNAANTLLQLKNLTNWV